MPNIEIMAKALKPASIAWFLSVDSYTEMQVIRNQLQIVTNKSYSPYCKATNLSRAFLINSN